MKIAYKNILENYATIAATNEDGNKPITNIFSTYLSILFSTTAGSTVITITFSEDQTADSFFLAETDLDPGSTVVVVYKNAATATIYTDNLVTTGPYILKSYFTKLTTIRSITITITNNDAGVSFFIGSIWISEVLQIPETALNAVHSHGNLPGYNKSTSGSVSGQIRNILKGWEYVIPVIENQNDIDALETYVSNINNLPHIVDFYDLLDDWVFYCHLVPQLYQFTRTSANDRLYKDYRLNYEEAT